MLFRIMLRVVDGMEFYKNAWQRKSYVITWMVDEFNSIDEAYAYANDLKAGSPHHIQKAMAEEVD
jgi:hypothetical protein